MKDNTSQPLESSFAKWTILLAITQIFSSTGVAASPLIDVNMVSITNVSVRVVSAGLQYDPMPGFEVRRFEKDVRGILASGLSMCGIAADSSAHLVLKISFGKADDKRAPGLVALQYSLQLEEPAQLDRTTANTKLDSHSIVTTWSSSGQEIASREEAISRLLEASSNLVGDFAREVGRARDYYLGSTKSGVPTSCWESEN
jgi:hypothetical protein